MCVCFLSFDVSFLVLFLFVSFSFFFLLFFFFFLSFFFVSSLRSYLLVLVILNLIVMWNPVRFVDLLFLGRNEEPRSECSFADFFAGWICGFFSFFEGLSM